MPNYPLTPLCVEWCYTQKWGIDSAVCKPVARQIKDEETAKLLTAAANAVLRFAEVLECDAVELAEHMANTEPTWMLQQIEASFRAKKDAP